MALLWPHTTQIQLHAQQDKWASCDVIAMMCAYEWWGQGVSYCQIQWASHTSFCFRLWSHLICSYRPSLINHFFFFPLSLAVSVALSLFCRPVVLPPYLVLQINLLLGPPSPDPDALHGTSTWEPLDPLATRRLPSIDVLFSVNLSESFSALNLTGMRCSRTVIAARPAACRSCDRTAACTWLGSDGDVMSPVQCSSACPRASSGTQSRC